MANNIVQVILVLGIAFLHSRQKRQESQVFDGVEVEDPEDVREEDVGDVLKK